MKIFSNQRPIVSFLLLGLIYFGLFTIVTSAGAETVKLQLKWKHQFQFAGYYAAIEKGYYAQEGIVFSKPLRIICVLKPNLLHNILPPFTLLYNHIEASAAC